MKKHIIYKGFHRPFPFKILGLCREYDYIIKRNFIFTDSCKYELDKGDQLDWNKLFGISFGLFGIHKNSVRFVWRYNPDKDIINIGAYWYVNGIRDYYSLVDIPFNKEYTFKITILGNQVIFTVLDEFIAIGKFALNVFDDKTISKNKYKCGIYFGGNRRAPQRIEIVEHKIN